MRVDPTYISSLVSALDGAQIREQQFSNQLASGARINSIGDDPVSAGRNVLLLNQITTFLTIGVIPNECGTVACQSKTP